MRARVTRSCGVWKYCARRWIRFVYCSRSASPNTSSSTLPMPQSSAMWLRLRRRPDPFVAVTIRLREWFEAEPWRTSRELFERLQAEYPGVYPDGQLRTCQRRLKEWRREAALQLVFGTASVDLDSKNECPAVA